MAEIMLSEAEKTFIIHGIQDNLRIDGRGCEDFRHMEIETNVSPQTAGSAHVKLGNTDVLVAVKAEIGRPLVHRQNEGRVEFSVNFSACASPLFEGRGGDSLAMTLTTNLATAYSFDDCLDLKSLCLVEREQCWILFVDIVLLSCDGNLFDSVSLAVKAALHNTRIPNVIVAGIELGRADLEIPDDPYDCRQLNIRNVPCLVTVSKVSHCHIVDASMQEESCSLSSVVMGVTEDGMITAVKKYRSTCLDPLSLMEMMDIGKRIGQALNRALSKFLEEEDKRIKFLAVNATAQEQAAVFLR